MSRYTRYLQLESIETMQSYPNIVWLTPPHLHHRYGLKSQAVDESWTRSWGDSGDDGDDISPAEKAEKGRYWT